MQFQFDFPVFVVADESTCATIKGQDLADQLQVVLPVFTEELFAERYLQLKTLAGKSIHAINDRNELRDLILELPGISMIAFDPVAHRGGYSKWAMKREVVLKHLVSDAELR